MRLLSFVKVGGTASAPRCARTPEENPVPADPGLSPTRMAGLVLVMAVLAVQAARNVGGNPSGAWDAFRKTLSTSALESDSRLAPVRDRLPARGVVQLAWSRGAEVELGYLSQFALAPLVLTTEPARGRLLLEDPRISALPANAAGTGLRLLHRTNDGIGLWLPEAP